MTLFEAVIIQIIQWQSVNGTHFVFYILTVKQD